MEWLRPSSARSNVITSASARDRMPRPCCVSYRRGSHTTMRLTRTGLSVIVHPVSSLQLTKDLDLVRGLQHPANTKKSRAVIRKTQRRNILPQRKASRRERPSCCHIVGLCIGASIEIDATAEADDHAHQSPHMMLPMPFTAVDIAHPSHATLRYDIL